MAIKIYERINDLTRMRLQNSVLLAQIWVDIECQVGVAENEVSQDEVNHRNDCLDHRESSTHY